MTGQDDHPATKADIADLDAKIDGLDARVGGLDAKVGGLDARVGKLEGAVSRIAVDQVDLRGEMRAMGDRLATLIRGESEKTLARIDAFTDRIERFDRESHTLPKTLDEHGKRLRDHESRIASLESARGA